MHITNNSMEALQLTRERCTEGHVEVRRQIVQLPWPGPSWRFHAGCHSVEEPDTGGKHHVNQRSEICHFCKLKFLHIIEM